MKRINGGILLVFVVLAGTGVRAQPDEKLYFIAPTQIPHVSREMKTAGFWIGRTPKPDRLIMNAPAIEAFNRQVQGRLKLTKDLRDVPNPFSGQELEEELLSMLSGLKEKNYFAENGESAPEEFFDEMKDALAIEKIEDGIDLQYGLIVRFSDQRFLPTDEGLYAAARDIDFDELQNSDLDIATPVVVLHQSADKKWLYVFSEASDGWVKAQHVALCSRDQLEDYLARQEFVVATDGKADIYLNEGMTQFYDHVRMGTKLAAYKETTPSAYIVLLPMRQRSGGLLLKDAYINKTQASRGFLDFTPRHVLEQAFKLLNDPYGWGGMHGEQDCSRFLTEVFSTVGLRLPRDSKNQAQVGRAFAKFDEGTPPYEKLNALSKVSAGGIILPLKGHIMLYLGMINERPYAIHAVWGYREPTEDGDMVRVINRVAVTDLYLGEGSEKGSLIKRLNAIISLRQP